LLAQPAQHRRFTHLPRTHNQHHRELAAGIHNVLRDAAGKIAKRGLKHENLV
jgi:hypothetical protein